MDSTSNNAGIPLLGDKFPKMRVQTTKGVLNLPEYFKGKWFVLFSHPADFTPVCTTEFAAFQKRHRDFKKLNCELIGLSVDQVFSHMKWTEWIKENLNIEIEFPIIADTGEAAKRLGLIHPAKGANTVRAVFVVDSNSNVRALVYYPQELGRNIDEILRIVKGLQTADREKAAIPANWPKNDLVGDRLIVPPAQNESERKKRVLQAKQKQIECFDWWLCHKKPSSKL